MRVLRINDSSNVRELSYDPERQQLTVEFSGGSVYRYDHVQHFQFGELAAAQSVGKLLNSTIVRKKDAHPFVKVRDQADFEASEEERILEEQLQSSADLDPALHLRRALEQIADFQPTGSGPTSVPSAFVACKTIAARALGRPR